MASRELPNVKLKGFWLLGEDNYKDEMDLNLLKLSVLTQGGVNSKVSALPGSPANGDVHILDETVGGGNANKIVIRDAGAWIYVTPALGWMLYNRATTVFQVFSGTEWVAFEGGLAEAPEDGRIYGRKDAAWEQIAGAAGGYKSVAGWRVIADAPGSDGTNVAWGEITFFYENNDEVFIAAGLDASSAKSGKGAIKAFDKNYDGGNGWEADIPTTEDAIGAWVSCTFTYPQRVAAVKLHPITGDEDKAPEEFRVQYYDEDLATWVDAGAFATEWPDNVPKVFSLDFTEDAPTSDGIDEAPNDGVPYVRRNEAWASARTQLLDTDGTAAANSDTVAMSQKAARTYIAAVLAGLVDLKGDLDASANPNYPAALKGDAYEITVAGKVGGGSGPDVEIGDLVIAMADNAGGTHASVGGSWNINAAAGAEDAGPQIESIIMAVTGEDEVLTTGTEKFTFRMPYAFTLTAVRASLTVASSSGNPVVDIGESGVSFLATQITIDSGEKTSTTAATAPVIADGDLADDAEITIDIDTAGTGAKGLKVYLIGYQP